ncbi:MAG TPA: four helix bundle protein [Kiritimatiellia bacterium]|nr:four helix bundle protein [Kiritimatiellia bacterium]
MEMFGKGAGYRWMDAYLLAWVVELATDSFCARFLDYKNDPQGKTSAQMNHAARSGCRNFAEGCERLMTSSASGMDLLNVAKGSLGELRDDYLKWLLRARRLPWDDSAPDALAVRRTDLDPAPGGGTERRGGGDAAGGAPVLPGLPGQPGRPVLTPGQPGRGAGAPYSNRRFGEHLLAQYAKFERWLESPDSFVRADALLILCTRAAKMQEAYIRRLGEAFANEGGFKERLGEARREARAKQEPAALHGEPPRCPACGQAMRLMRRKRDNSPFWGCSDYPGCSETLPCA